MNKLTIEKCKRYAINKEGFCLSETYIDAKSLLIWKCKHNHTWKANADNCLNKNKWCAICAGVKKYTIEKAKEEAVKRNGKCLSDVYVNIKSHLEWKCEFNHTWKTSLNTIMHCNTWCPYCLVSKENMLYELLKIIFNNSEIYRNYNKFKWLKTSNNGTQRIDFFIKNNNFSLAIEYDGIQHFKSIKYFGGIKKLQYTQKMDNIKNEKINSYNSDVNFFIRIPYWEKMEINNIKNIIQNKGVLI